MPFIPLGINSRTNGVVKVAKEVLIKISLVDESSQKTNRKIADEIFNDLTEGKITIPWCRKVDLVAVKDKQKAFSVQAADQ